MKKNNLPTILLIIGVIAIVITPYLLTQFGWFIDLSTDSSNNIGSAIGGITAPILGLVSIFLIFYTYRLQLNTSIDSSKKRNFDILYKILNETFDKFNSLEYKNIGIKGIKTEADGSIIPSETEISTFKGKIALNYFRRDIFLVNQNYDFGSGKRNYTLFRKSYVSELIETIDSFVMICDKMKEYELLPNEHDILKSKIQAFYKRNLKMRLNEIYSSIKDIDDIKMADMVLENETQQLKDLKEIIFALTNCLDKNINTIQTPKH